MRHTQAKEEKKGEPETKVAAAPREEGTGGPGGDGQARDTGVRVGRRRPFQEKGGGRHGPFGV